MKKTTWKGWNQQQHQQNHTQPSSRRHFSSIKLFWWSLQHIVQLKIASYSLLTFQTTLHIVSYELHKLIIKCLIEYQKLTFASKMVTVVASSSCVGVLVSSLRWLLKLYQTWIDRYLSGVLTGLWFGLVFYHFRYSFFVCLLWFSRIEVVSLGWSGAPHVSSSDGKIS